MRIVGGSLSGRRFPGPGGDGTRPTSERAREAIASALTARGWIAGARVLDLYAGTGALAFECLSRGAEAAVLVDKDRRAVQAMRQSAKELGLAGHTRIARADLTRGWPPALWEEPPFDLAFADPPYRDTAAAVTLLRALAEEGRLRPGAAVVVEHDRKVTPELDPAFDEVGTYRFGDTTITVRTTPENAT